MDKKSDYFKNYSVKIIASKVARVKLHVVRIRGNLVKIPNFKGVPGKI